MVIVLEERKHSTLHDLVIYCVDYDTYHSGGMTDYLRVFKSTRPELRFFDILCNWTSMKDTERYYHALAEDAYQAESLAIAEYATEMHVGKSFVQAETH